MSESGFETYLIMKHGKRWEIKNKIEKVERKLKYMLFCDNNARFSKYLTSLSSPSDILNCERGGVKELSSLEEEVLKEKVSAEASYGERFSDNGRSPFDGLLTMVKYMTGTKRRKNLWKFGKYTLRSNCGP